jgi:hypothetical protein
MNLFFTNKMASSIKWGGALVLAICMLALIGCGGTKVYTIDKTITYRDALYNMSTVQKITSREEAALENGSVVNLRNKEKKELEQFFKDNPGVMVSMIVDMDQQEMVYLRMKVEKYSEYSRLKKRFDNALKDITKFMGDKKATQLNLK